MAYTRAWDETAPAGTVLANTLDTVIQNFKTDIRERVAGIFGLTNIEFAADPIVPKTLTLSTSLAIGTPTVFGERLSIKGNNVNAETVIVDSLVGQIADIQTWRKNGVVVADITSTGALEIVSISFQIAGGLGVITEPAGGAMSFTTGAGGNGNQVFNVAAAGGHFFQYNGVTKHQFGAALSTFTGDITSLNHNLTGAAGVQKNIRFQTNGNARWLLLSGAQAETGADAGSDFNISAYNDAGANIDTPLSIIRAAGGLITWARPTQFNNTLTQAGTANEVAVQGRVRITAVSTSAALTGSIFRSAASGLAFFGITGTNFDYYVGDPVGVPIIQVPTGTRNVSFGANITVPAASVSRLGAAIAGQSTATVNARNAGNNIEFGHPNLAGFGSTLGSESGSGLPFIAFAAEAGTAANTYMTRGNRGSIFRGDNAGGFTWSNVANANLDSQALVNLATLSNAGLLTAVGGFSGNITGNVTGNITGTVLTAAQPNITSLGALTSLVFAAGATISKFLTALLTWDVPLVAANSFTQTTIAVAGCAVGDAVLVCPKNGTGTTQSFVFDGYVSAAGTVTVTAHNPTAGGIDLPSDDYRIIVMRVA